MTNYRYFKVKSKYNGTPPDPINLLDNIDWLEWVSEQGRKQLRPEQLLLLAVVECALVDLRDNSEKHQKDRADAIEWFRSRSTCHVFTFESICLVFGFDPTQIRRELKIKEVEI